MGSHRSSAQCVEHWVVVMVMVMEMVMVMVMDGDGEWDAFVNRDSKLDGRELLSINEFFEEEGFVARRARTLRHL